MGKPKFSLKNVRDYKSYLLDNAGEHLSLAIKVAEFIKHPELAEQLRHIMWYEFTRYKNLYSIIPMPTIKKLHSIMLTLQEAVSPLVNSNYDLLPDAIHLLTNENEVLFSITEPVGGHKVYNFYNCLSRVEALESYFKQAMDLNKEIEYGKYT